jgi:meso-butanediol dehydrogenase / (S,S)-butanediol dehydrogenase / diacetyl reductase
MEDGALDFSGKVALVTGTTGIGRATSLRLAAQGAAVIALGIDAAANAGLAQTPGVSVMRCDVSDADAVSTVFSGIETQQKRLDIIVNAAAIHPYGDAVDTSPGMFAKCLAVNAGSIHLTAHFGVPIMRQAGNGGVIVNLSSVQGHACQAGVMAYVASKGAIHAMTRAMALDFARDKIRVVSVSPGSVRTPILELAARTFDGPDADIDDVFQRFGAAHPIGRIGEPEEVAEFIAYLASDKAGFITGSDHIIDGALTAALGVR